MSKAPRAPENTRIYAIGDIHGCADLLETLLDQIIANDQMLYDIEVKNLVFLGDYVDRGPESARVLNILLHELPKGYEAIFLKGNHELMLLEALESSQAADFWLRNGGRETIASYNIRLSSYQGAAKSEELMHVFNMRLPLEHLEFLNSLQLSFETEDYFFVHAGIHPDRPLNSQQEKDMLWIRDRFLFSEKDFGKIIVHGHTPGGEVDEANNQIGIDTAAVYGGSLTALMIDQDKRQYLHAKAKKKDRKS